VTEPGDYLQRRAGRETGSESRAHGRDLHDERSPAFAFERCERTYKVKAMVESQNAKDAKEITFAVR